MGCDRNEGNDGSEIRTLFGSYSKHCKDSGNVAKSNKTFSPDLVELCNSVLGWDVKHKSTNTGKYICGVRLRVLGVDDHIPTQEIFLIEKIKSDGLGDGLGDGSELLLCKENGGSDGLIQSLIENQKENNQLDFWRQEAGGRGQEEKEECNAGVKDFLSSPLPPAFCPLPSDLTQVCSNINDISVNESNLNPSLIPQSLPGKGFDPSLNSSLNSSLNENLDEAGKDVAQTTTISGVGFGGSIDNGSEDVLVPPPINFQVGDRIEFQHELKPDWLKGEIIDIKTEKGFFVGMTVRYQEYNYKTKQRENREYVICREDWVRRR